MAESRLTIRGLRVRTVDVPMPHPHRTASGTITSSPLVLTDLLTDAGVVGSSYVFCYTAVALKPTALLLQGLEPLLVGQPVAPLELERQLAGALPAARRAGPDRDRPGGDRHGRLGRARPRPRPAAGPAARGRAEAGARCTASIGYDGADGAAREAAAWAERGVTGVKAKIGYPDVREDRAVIRAIRRAAGDDMAVMVDYNQSLTPVEAIERARTLDDEGLTWIEEPTRAEDYAGMAEVARAAATPIQAGENWWGPQELAKAIAAGASDYVMPDVMKIGGVTGWQRAAAIAAASGRLVSSHLFVGGQHAPAGRDAHRALAGVRRLVQPGHRGTAADRGRRSPSRPTAPGRASSGTRTRSRATPPADDHDRQSAASAATVGCRRSGSGSVARAATARSRSVPRSR